MRLRRRRGLAVWVVGLAAAGVGSGCVGVSVPGPGDSGSGDGMDDGADASGVGAVRLSVTDKPYPFEFIESATITITRVELRAPGDFDVVEDEDGDFELTEADGETFVVIFEGERVFNLLDLQNGRTDLLAEAEVPAGAYTQTRLIVTEGVVTLTDGRMLPLDVPSGEQTGIKLNFDFEVAEGETRALLLDVDLSRAFKAIPGGRIDEVGGISDFMFQPSVAMRLIDLIETGEMSGTVRDIDMRPLSDVAVTAYDADGDEVTSTATDEDGTYVLVGLLPGAYRVEFELSGYAVETVEPVEVVSGVTTAGVDVILLLDDVTRFDGSWRVGGEQRAEVGIKEGAIVSWTPLNESNEAMSALDVRSSMPVADSGEASVWVFETASSVYTLEVTLLADGSFAGELTISTGFVSTMSSVTMTRN